jgi:hypothetical protein
MHPAYPINTAIPPFSWCEHRAGPVALLRLPTRVVHARLHRLNGCLLEPRKI